MLNVLISLTSFLGIIAIIIQFYYSLNRKLAQGFSVIYATNNFFSYFTILTNSVIAILLASYVFFPNSKVSLWFKKTINNSAILLNIFIVSFIYYTLLNSRDLQGLEIVATHILHGFVPLVYLVLWFFVFRKGDLKFSSSIKWLKVPYIYFIYILIRGEILNVYPYFFINVNQYGYPRVLLFSIGILFIFFVIGLGIVIMDQKIKPRVVIKS